MVGSKLALLGLVLAMHSRGLEDAEPPARRQERIERRAETGREWKAFDELRLLPDSVERERRIKEWWERNRQRQRVTQQRASEDLVRRFQPRAYDLMLEVTATPAAITTRGVVEITYRLQNQESGWASVFGEFYLTKGLKLYYRKDGGEKLLFCPECGVQPPARTFAGGGKHRLKPGEARVRVDRIWLGGWLGPGTYEFFPEFDNQYQVIKGAPFRVIVQEASATELVRPPPSLEALRSSDSLVEGGSTGSDENFLKLTSPAWYRVDNPDE